MAKQVQFDVLALEHLGAAEGRQRGWTDIIPCCDI